MNRPRTSFRLRACRRRTPIVLDEGQPTLRAPDPRSVLSKVGRRRCVVAVPVLDGSILGLQKAQQASVRAVSQTMATGFNRIARRESFSGHANLLESGATGRFERPHLSLTFFIL